MTLREQIERFQAEMMPTVPPDVGATIMAATARLLATDPARHSLALGEAMPAFRLPDLHGNEVSSTELLAGGPLVLSFYRGGWCPYCNLELRALRQALPQIHDAGGRLVAVSPQKPDLTLPVVEELDLGFQVLSDTGNQVSRRFGLVVVLDEALRPIYRQFGFDLTEHNGDGRWELPMPATYVVDTAGVVRYVFVDADYTKRAEPAEVVQVLRRLSVSAAAPA